MITRRRFLSSSSLLALAPTVPLFVARTARAAPADRDARALVVVQLDGGNDALNTAVPHADPEYAKSRPTLKLAKRDLVPLTDALGLHPALKPLDKLLGAGHLAVLPGVGYPNPHKSHFEDLDVWHTARFDPDERKSYGWLGRALDPSAGTAYALGGAVPAALRGRRSTAVALGRLQDSLLSDPATAKRSVGPAGGGDLLEFVRRQAVDGHGAADKLAALAAGDGAGDPATGLAARLRQVARLLKAGLGARVFYTLQAGYDTHAAQPAAHARLLAEFAGAVADFFAELATAKLADRVALLAFSEFGRAVKENGSGGTDHGTAGVVFLAGPGVTGGVVGTLPSLTDLEGGEPKMTTDFRRVYSSVLADWLGLPADGLGAPPPALRLFRA